MIYDFFDFFIVFNVKDNVKSLLKSYYNFIVSLLLFSVILLIFVKSFHSIFVVISFFLFRLLFSTLSLYVVIIFAVVVFLIMFLFSIFVICVIDFITFAYVFVLID